MEKTQYVDSHAHLLAEEFQADLPQVLQRIQDAGIARVMIVTTRPQEARRGFSLAAQDPQRFALAYGIHPEDIDLLNEELFQEFLLLAADSRLQAIGEIGLDYHWQPETKAAQQQLLIRQIEAAQKLNKPILVHSRDAAQDTLDLLREHPCRGVLHCFSGSAEMAAEYTKLGYYISLGGPVTFKNARHAKEVAAAVDLRFLLSETDCPYMAPEPVRGSRNEPSNIPYIVRVIAQIRGMSEQDLAAQILVNYERFLAGGTV